MKTKSLSPSVYHRYFALCLITAFCMLLLGCSLMLSPFVNYSEEGSRASGIALSIVTWGLTLGIIAMLLSVCRFASRCAAKDPGRIGKRYKRAKIGLFTFAANPEGLAAELAFLSGAILFVLRTAAELRLPSILRMLPYSLCFSGFMLHCFLNGKSYIYIKAKSLYDEKGSTEK